MAKSRLNTDDALRNIIGKVSDVQPKEAEQPEIKKEKEKESQILNPVVTDKDKFIQASFYITEKHRKALKMRTALSDKPDDKDQSSIVRAALDAYLADTMQAL